MKRYAMDYYMESTLNGPACNVTMVEDADGEWVRNEDADRLRHECENHKRVRDNHVQANHAAQEECRELREENDRLRAALKMIQSLGEGGGYDMRDMEMYCIAVDALPPNA